MGELYNIEKLFEILHKEYGNYLIKETVKVKDWDTERNEEMECERTLVRICPAPGKTDTFGCTIADDLAITLNGRSVLWEDVNDEDISSLRAYVYKWLLRYADGPEQIYSDYTPTKLLNWKELPYLPGVSATALQEMRSSASFIIQNRSALGEYFTEDEIAGTARFLDKLSHIYPIGTK
jgi:hypothetical protein